MDWEKRKPPGWGRLSGNIVVSNSILEAPKDKPKPRKRQTPRITACATREAGPGELAAREQPSWRWSGLKVIDGGRT